MAHTIVKHVFRRKCADFAKQIVFSAHFAHQIKIISNIRKRGKSLFIKDLPRYYKFMLFAVYYPSIAPCAAARRAMGTRKGEHDV